jgi:hypothetical protein
VLAVFATFNFVCLSMALFNPDPAHTWSIVSDVVRQFTMPRQSSFLPAIVRESSVHAVVGMSIVGGAASMLMLGIVWKRAAIAQLIEKERSRISNDTVTLYCWVLLKAVLLVIAFLLLWACDEKDPVVVYIRF